MLLSLPSSSPVGVLLLALMFATPAFAAPALANFALVTFALATFELATGVTVKVAVYLLAAERLRGLTPFVDTPLGDTSLGYTPLGDLDAPVLAFLFLFLLVTGGVNARIS